MAKYTPRRLMMRAPITAASVPTVTPMRMPSGVLAATYLMVMPTPYAPRPK